MMFSESDIDRFWSKVNKTDSCWEWSGIKTRFGYGLFQYTENKKKIKRMAHRISWIITNGNIEEGNYICHKCDNPKCVRPDHLFSGTHQDNMDDMIEKGRNNNFNYKLRGVTYRTKLSIQNILDIKSMVNEKQDKEISVMFDVREDVIKRIRDGVTFKNIS